MKPLLLFLSFIVFVLSNSSLSIAKNFAATKFVKPTILNSLNMQACGEDYTKHPIDDFTPASQVEFYREYFDGVYGSKNWYLCMLDDDVTSRMQCSSGWSAVGPLLYSYECQQNFETKVDILFPDASRACYSGYSLADTFSEASPFDTTYFASYQCEKDGSRSSQSPCSSGYSSLMLLSAENMICSK